LNKNSQFFNFKVGLIHHMYFLVTFLFLILLDPKSFLGFVDDTCVGASILTSFKNLTLIEIKVSLMWIVFVLADVCILFTLNDSSMDEFHNFLFFKAYESTFISIDAFRVILKEHQEFFIHFNNHQLVHHPLASFLLL